MSVPSTDLKHKYEGNGVQTEWPFTFKVFTKEEILVKKISSGGEVVLTLDVDYTVSGAGTDSGGGFVTYPILGSELAVGEFIVLKPNLEYSQDLILLNQNTFPPKPVEYAMDRLAMQIKQVAEQLSRSLQLTDAYDGDAESFIELITAGSAGLIASLKGTSLTSVAVGTGAKAFTTQSGKSWSLGQRLRAASDDGSKVIEGPVTSYSGTTLTITADFTAGAGSHADWNISLAGERGASGAGTGDMLGANNGTDFASASTTFDNLKQAATTSYSGVMRLATSAEVLAGLVTNAAVTPETLQYKIEVLGSFGLIVITDPVSIGTGTTKDFTIPTKARRITLHLSGVSLNASDNVIIQLGDAGGIETIGYTGSITTLATSTLATVGTGANGMAFANSAQLASTLYSGDIVLEKVSSSSNSWNIRGQLSTGSTAQYIFTGNKILDQELTTIRLTSYGGAATFDAGTVSYSVEY